MVQFPHISLKKDNYMKFRFYINSFVDHRINKKIEIPSIEIIDSLKYGECFNSEVANLSLEYLNEIVPSLEQVLSGVIERYDFGYEVYSIECTKEISKVMDISDNWKAIAEIQTQEIYELMKDWRNYRVVAVCAVNQLLCRS